MTKTTHSTRRVRRVALATSALFVLAQTPGAGPTAQAAVEEPYSVLYQTDPIPFSLDEVLGNTLGVSEGSVGNVVIGDDEGEDTSGNIINWKTGTTLYPIDSGFTSDVLDFFGATPRPMDGVPEEGWVGVATRDVAGVGTLTGLEFANVATDRLNAGAPLGTWAAGLGDTSVKASTEHYTVMEGVLTCFQTHPYDYWESYEDWDSNGDGVGPDNPSIPVRTQAALDAKGLTCLPLQSPTGLVELDGVTPGDLTTLTPNEDSVISDMLVDPDMGYSVTKKDDGKLLFRWGSMVKKPTDIRFQKTIPLPDEWLAVPEGERGYTVTSAELVVRHLITNNPNDQIRPEDWENEAATGWLPGYTDAGNGYWYSDTGCYEGDGDYIPAGTILKQPPLPQYAGVDAADLANGYTAAWTTTIDRDPFQWAYDNGTEIVGSRVPDSTLGELVSGPRWRMTANKFGQNLPSLEIPAEPCTPPPYQQGETRYDTGEFTTTTINLLDWNQNEPRWDDAASPLAYSAGWINDWSTAAVPGMIVHAEDAERCHTTNAAGQCVTALGTTLTDDFDVTFYVKGDQKPLQVFDVQLRLEYEGDEPPPVMYDFGDAPEGYPEASAMVDLAGPMLGTTVDAELATLASPDANGDGADDDGVLLAAYGPLASASISMTGVGYVQGWIDYNGDQLFAAEELVVSNLTEPGRVTFAAPAEATIARFRIDDSPDRGPEGLGGRGEIEDYLVPGAVDIGTADAFTMITPVEVFNQRIGVGLNSIAVTEMGEVPWYATEVVMEITTTDADSPGSITAVGCDSSTVVSDLLYRPGTDASTTAVAPVDHLGNVCLHVSKETVEVTVTAVGYTPVNGAYHSVLPVAAVDTTLAPEEEVTFFLDDTTASAYLVAVSSEKAKGRGEVSIYADPLVRYDVLNTVPGRQVTNLAVVPAGDLIVESEAATNLVIEVRGVFTADVPVLLELADQRIGAGTPLGLAVPGAEVAIVNLRLADGDQDGVLTVLNGGDELAHVTFQKKATAAQFVVVDATEPIQITTTTGVDLVVNLVMVTSAP